MNGMNRQTYRITSSLATADIWQDTAIALACPVCGESGQLAEGCQTILSNRGTAWSGLGDLLVVNMSGLCGHRWQLCVGEHKGSSYLFSQTNDVVDYPAYLQSSQWRDKADAAKARAGYRCQVCYRTGELDTHHRTYERIGYELPEDLTVLCRSCHQIFEDAKRLPVRG